MDTRSKSIKYSLFTKFICLILSAVCFASAALNCYTLFIGVRVVGFENVIENKKVDFFETDQFSVHFSNDVSTLAYISGIHKSLVEKAANEQKPEIINRILNNFLLERGKIIRDELSYVAENWDEDYYAYEDGVENFTAVNGEKIYYSDDGPLNVQLAQEIVGKVRNPIDYNQYENLVREEALQSDYYYHNTFSIDVEGGNSYSFSVVIDSLFYYYADENTARNTITEIVEDSIDTQIYNSFYLYENDSDFINLHNLKYYAETPDGRTFTNIEEMPENIKEYKHFVYAKGEKYISNGFGDIVEKRLSDIFADKKYGTVCMYFEDNFEKKYSIMSPFEAIFSSDADDVYGRMYSIYREYSEHDAIFYAIRVICFLILSFLFFILLLMFCGHKNDYEGIKLSSIDKFPVDLHFIINAFSAFVLPVLFLQNIISYDITPIKISKMCLCLSTVVFSLVFIEYFCSVARIKKSGKGLFKRTSVYMLALFLVKYGKKLKVKLKSEIAYKPAHFKVQVILAILGYFFVNIALIVLFAIMVTAGVGVFCFVPVWGIVVFNCFVAYFVVKYVNNLDRIIVASTKGETVTFASKDTPKSLQTLASSLETTNEELEKAVEEAVKNEQMKTQLITNVSHDLKTPLTSLINYSDLLSKCDIDNDQAKTYIDVINTQSVKLKRLIEDLIEASKVSTGNIQLNNVTLNLHELCVQAIVEFTPDFDKNYIDVIFTEPKEPVYIYADGTKTYRIISNLLSNVKKYAAPYTRAYISVYKSDNDGVIEIKNVSKEQLNISPEQLTERFVRGDESRTNEGNGLGLSIAKDLCSLQNGELNISIDGDLFKVSVKLPVAERRNEE